MDDFLYETQRSMADEACFAEHETRLKLDATRIAHEVAEGCLLILDRGRLHERHPERSQRHTDVLHRRVRYDGYPGSSR